MLHWIYRLHVSLWERIVFVGQESEHDKLCVFDCSSNVTGPAYNNDMAYHLQEN